MIFNKIIDNCAEESPWLIMVHGFTHNHKYFYEQINHFQTDYKILVVDLRGHGESQNIPGPYGVEEYADDIEEVLKHLGITKAVYWGTHTGSAIGLVLALRNPECFSSLILEGAFLPGFHMPRTNELISTAKAIAQVDGVETALKYWFIHADWFKYIRKYPLKCRAEKHKEMLSEFFGNPLVSELSPRAVVDVSASLTNIKQPTFVYNGKYDLGDFINAAIHLESNLQNVIREVIPEAGGFPGWENPMEVNKLVQNYLNSSACRQR